MRDPVALEFRRQIARLEAAERRMAMMVITGKVEIVDAGKRRLRLNLGKSANGKDVLSPWIRWQESGVGALSVHSEPEKGEQMIMLSASGTVGAGSIAMPSTFDKDHSAPSSESDRTVIMRQGGRIVVAAPDIDLIGNIHFRDGNVDHDDVDIGKTHRHTGVESGAGLTGEPQS